MDISGVYHNMDSMSNIANRNKRISLNWAVLLWRSLALDARASWTSLGHWNTLKQKEFVSELSQMADRAPWTSLPSSQGTVESRALRLFKTKRKLLPLFVRSLRSLRFHFGPLESLVSLTPPRCAKQTRCLIRHPFRQPSPA